MSRLVPDRSFGSTVKTESISAFQLSERVYPGGLQTPRHYHDRPLFCFVIEGSYTETYASRLRECSPSAVVFHAPGESHSERFHDKGGRSFVVEIDPAWMEKLKVVSRVSVENTVDFRGGVLSMLGQRLYSEFQAIDEISPLVIEGVMLQMTAEASRQPQHHLRPPAWLSRAREMLQEEFSQGVNLTGLAQEVGVHPVHLSQTFSKFFGCTVGEYVRKLRVDYASRRLANTDAPLSQIAIEAGFSDQSHFNRSFKRATGLTPLELRQSLRRMKP